VVFITVQNVVATDAAVSITS